MLRNDDKLERNAIKVGVMQPYFFPYIGYWQLMNAVDRYVIYDDVNYINRGWINRNRILFGGQPKYFNLPLLGASQNKLINQIFVNNDEKLINRNASIIREAYKKAPYFSDVYPLIEEVLNCKKRTIAEYIKYSFEIVCKYIGIDTTLIMSSSLDKNCQLKGQSKILDICSVLGATHYYNAIGGQELYDYNEFLKNGIELRFLETNDMKYKQFGNEFYSNLSIIDVMMFNSKEEISQMLTKFSLIK